MTISGHTLVYALIGHPVDHVKTPELYNSKFAKLGIDAVVVPIDVSPQDLSGFVHFARGWKNLAGIGVTIPHKEAMANHVDSLTTSAQLCGATNVIRRNSDGTLLGTQMDGPGFVSALGDRLNDGRPKRALLAGAGGTAKAIAFELAASGLAELVLTNRTTERARALGDRVHAAYPNCTIEVTSNPTGHFDLIINATSVGMHESDVIPIDANLLVPTTIVADVIMSPPRTRLLHEAEKRGCVVYPGLRMLQAQFDATVEFLQLSTIDSLAAKGD